MTALTYDLRQAAATAKAEREIRLHRHLIPASALRELGLNADYKDASKLPFVK